MQCMTSLCFKILMNIKLGFSRVLNIEINTIETLYKKVIHETASVYAELLVPSHLIAVHVSLV